ncbi:MAG: DUF411 domain-containing protein [Betaproteobacteria bacterium]|nr:DUF411 domain-containing protein [Betaproteobacteria bacterium]
MSSGGQAGVASTLPYCGGVSGKDACVKIRIRHLLLLAALANPAFAGQSASIVDVYKSPTCGCCVQWVNHMKANGFTLNVHDTENVAFHKQRLGVPYGYGSCHTAVVNGYLVEGHVPAREVQRLLRERPDARGLAVPAMPSGAPGMAQGERIGNFDVLLVRKDGSTRTYARY